LLISDVYKVLVIIDEKHLTAAPDCCIFTSPSQRYGEKFREVKTENRKVWKFEPKGLQKNQQANRKGNLQGFKRYNNRNPNQKITAQAVKLWEKVS